MGLIQFHYTKVECSKDKQDLSKLNISQDVKLANVDIKSVGSSKDPNLVEVKFKVAANYNPGVGKIGLEGVALFTESPENMKLIKEAWDKNKKFPAKWGMHIMNVILLRTNIKIFIFSSRYEPTSSYSITCIFLKS